MPIAAVPRRASVFLTNFDWSAALRAGFGMRRSSSVRCELVRGALHGGLGGYSTEASIARLERLDRGVEVGVGPVGPETVREVELRVCGAPEQEVRDPLLAAGADQQVD